MRRPYARPAGRPQGIQSSRKGASAPGHRASSATRCATAARSSPSRRGGNGCRRSHQSSMNEAEAPGSSRSAGPMGLELAESIPVEPDREREGPELGVGALGKHRVALHEEEPGGLQVGHPAGGRVEAELGVLQRAHDLQEAVARAHAGIARREIEQARPCRVVLHVAVRQAAAGRGRDDGDPAARGHGPPPVAEGADLARDVGDRLQAAKVRRARLEAELAHHLEPGGGIGEAPQPDGAVRPGLGRPGSQPQGRVPRDGLLRAQVEPPAPGVDSGRAGTPPPARLLGEERQRVLALPGIAEHPAAAARTEDDLGELVLDRDAVGVAVEIDAGDGDQGEDSGAREGITTSVAP